MWKHWSHWHFDLDIFLPLLEHTAFMQQKNHKKHTVHEYLALYDWLALSQM